MLAHTAQSCGFVPITADTWRTSTLSCFTQVDYLLFFFFFQAEDGIRDLIVTGVQTCALRSQAEERRVGKECRSTLFPYTTLFRSDRKSTRLNSSHDQISYAVFCL